MSEMTSARRRLLPITLVSAVVLTFAALACTQTSSGSAVTSAPVATKAGGGETTAAATESGGEATQPAGNTPEASTSSAGGGEINTGNAADLTALRTVNVSSSPLFSSAFASTGHDVATLGFDRTLRVWDADTGKKVQEMPKHADDGWGLAFSRDGKLLASGAGFNVTFWDPSTGKKKSSLTPNAQVYRLAFSPDAKTLALAGNGSSKLELIDVSSGQVTETLASPKGHALWAAAYSPDGSMLAAADNIGNLVVFDANSKTVLGEGSARGAAYDVEFSPDGKYVTTCNASELGGITTWDTSSWAEYTELTLEAIHKGGCYDGVYSKSGDIYFSVGDDGVLNAWDTAKGGLLYNTSFGSQVISVTISGDGQLLAVTLYDGTLHILGLK